jgi:hypothetical protein
VNWLATLFAIFEKAKELLYGHKIDLSYRWSMRAGSFQGHVLWRILHAVVGSGSLGTCRQRKMLCWLTSKSVWPLLA